MSLRTSPEELAHSPMGEALLRALRLEDVAMPLQVLVAATEVVDQFLEMVDAAPSPADVARRVSMRWPAAHPHLEAALSPILPVLALLRREAR